MTEERAYWLAWLQIPGIGAVLLRRLHLHFGALSTAWNADPAELEQVDGLGRQTVRLVHRAKQTINPEYVLQAHEEANPCFWTPSDPDYPRLLLEIPDPPPVLYYRGEVEVLENQGTIAAIGIVGTRYPSEYGRRWSRKLSAALAKAGFTVVSGLAEGIDTEAHHSCLAAGGRTIAVLGTGVDVIYPWSNRTLAQHVSQHGLLLSEYPSGTQPDRVNFPRRNRIIAGLCRATLVIEAPRKSGALITARLANDYGRDVYVLPGSLDNDRSRGCLEFLNQGAHLILGEKELIDSLNALPQLDRLCLNPLQRNHTRTDRELSVNKLPINELPISIPPSTAQLSLLSNGQTAEAPTLPTSKLEPDLQTVLHAVTSEPVSLDRIVQCTNLTTGTVLSALSQLELMGFVSQLPGMRYLRE